MKSLLEEAARLGVKVHRAHLPDGHRGYYRHDDRIISVCLTLTPSEAREVLAHELGHAYYGHACGSAKHEEQADRRAALLLIDPDEYARAEREHPAVGAIADYLGIDSHLVLVWRQWWLPLLTIRRIGPAGMQ